EGRLKPIEEVVHLGRAVVRATFRVSKVGTIAGCHVTSGVIERSAKVRVIREGTVVFPPAERTASLDSLKRFKDDVKEVREGFECGMKIAGFDDVKVIELGVAAVGPEPAAVRGVLQTISEALRKHPVAEFLDCDVAVGTEVV